MLPIQHFYRQMLIEQIGKYCFIWLLNSDNIVIFGICSLKNYANTVRSQPHMQMPHATNDLHMNVCMYVFPYMFLAKTVAGVQ